MIKNYFAIMGLDISEVDELLKEDWDKKLKERYILLTKIFHPDKIAGRDDLPPHIDKTKVFNLANSLQVELNEAYEILSDPEKRNQYLTQVVKLGRFKFFEGSEMETVLKYAFRIQEILSKNNP